MNFNAAQMPSSINKKQTTFYSDGTAFTGITATTVATSSIKSKNQILMIKGGGPPAHNIKNSILDDGLGNKIPEQHANYR